LSRCLFLSLSLIYTQNAQLFGGVITYAHETKSKNIPSRFKGVNFSFDERMARLSLSLSLLSLLLSICFSFCLFLLCSTLSLGRKGDRRRRGHLPFLRSSLERHHELLQYIFSTFYFSSSSSVPFVDVAVRSGVPQTRRPLQ
jgi:hypothetical protein